MDRNEWYEQASEKILDNLEDFYGEFFAEYPLTPIGKGNHRMQPCPICGGRDCCTIGVAVNCFSCHWTGSHIKCCKDYHQRKGTGDEATMIAIGDYLCLPYPMGTPEEIEASRKRQRDQTIKRTAESFYHDQLLTSKKTFYVKGHNDVMTPMEYLVDVRKREMATIKDLRIGFSEGYLELREQLQNAGFTDEEIKAAKIWLPEGLFVFFYKHPSTKDIVRINTKNPFEVKHRSFDSQNKEVEGDLIQGYSVGNKAVYFSPKFDFKLPFAVVEGEHDLASSMENGCDNVCCIGGNLPDGLMGRVFEKAKDKIYSMFDNDRAGVEYLERINNELPHKDIYRIVYPELYKDPDEYYTKDADPKSWQSLVSNAIRLETEEYKVSHFGNAWVSGNRHKKLEFTITGKDKSGVPLGTIMYYVEDKFQDRDDNVSIYKAKAKMKPLTNPLINAMIEYYNCNLEEKDTEELAKIYTYAGHQGKSNIITLLAKRVIEAKDGATIIQQIRTGFSHTKKSFEDEVDAILKEVNSLRNKRVEGQLYPRMKLGQFFNVMNNDAYFYFTMMKADGESVRAIPYLLRNDKTLIRLDLFRKKDEQCVLLLDNKYQLPCEVKNAMFTEECTLIQASVDKYIEGLYSKEELSAYNLLQGLERYFKKFYHAEDQNLFKILALWAFGTYCYSLLGQYPYFHVQGEKGSGKSELGYTLGIFCFNARKSVHTTEAAVFRTTDWEGGTMIMDELESMTNVKQGVENVMGAILKGGYKEKQYVERYDSDSKTVIRYDVFSPKIVLNILGIDYIIGDRCLKIMSHTLDMSKNIKLEKVKSYWDSHMVEIREFTSRIAFCVLENFQTIHKIHCNNQFLASSARLTEIISPLHAIAKFADGEKLEEFLNGNPGANPEDYRGEYEQACHDFYNLYIKNKKEESEISTPEGSLKNILRNISLECLGLCHSDKREYLLPEKHRYREPIMYNNEEGWFEVNTVHLKCFMQQQSPQEAFYVRNIPRYLEAILRITTEHPVRYRRALTKVEDEELIKELKGAHPKVNHYRIYYKEFVESSVLANRVNSPKQEIEPDLDDNKPMF